jgi:Protein of unknown function (DUF2798)
MIRIGSWSGLRASTVILFLVDFRPVTSLIAAGIASFPSPTVVQFLGHWMWSWLIAWAIMLPVVVLAAPFIRTASIALTRD